MSMLVRIIADSQDCSSHKVRLTSFQLRFPTQILKEVNTHLVLSKSASSTRAIPVDTKLTMLMRNHYQPLEVGKNCKGMQSYTPLEQSQDAEFRRLWESHFETTVGCVKSLQALGAHKQEINPLLEPFDWTTQILTGTNWDNFFALRTHETAKPAFRTLARAMYLAYKKSSPRMVTSGPTQDLAYYHLPFWANSDEVDFGSRVQKADRLIPQITQFLDERLNGAGLGILESMTPQLSCAMVVSSARCARVSYNKIGTTSRSTLEEDFTTFQTLMQSPMHASPMQHQARNRRANDQKYFANYRGWMPFRKMLKNECVDEFTPSEAAVSRWEDEIDPKIWNNTDADWE